MVPAVLEIACKPALLPLHRYMLVEGNSVRRASGVEHSTMRGGTVVRASNSEPLRCALQHVSCFPVRAWPLCLHARQLPPNCLHPSLCRSPQALVLEAEEKLEAQAGGERSALAAAATTFYEVTIASIDQPKLLSRLSESLVRMMGVLRSWTPAAEKNETQGHGHQLFLLFEQGECFAGEPWLRRTPWVLQMPWQCPDTLDAAAHVLAQQTGVQ